MGIIGEFNKNNLVGTLETKKKNPRMGSKENMKREIWDEM